MDISSIALTGMQDAQGRFERAVAGVTKASTDSQDTVDLSQHAVDLVAAKNQFAADVQVERTADQMQKSLLNILA